MIIHSRSFASIVSRNLIVRTTARSSRFFFLIFYVRWGRGRSINSTMNIQRVVRLFPLEKPFDYTKCRVIGASKRYTYVDLLQGRLSLSSIINIYMILSLSYIVHFVLSNKKLIRFNSSADITQ